MSQQWTKGPGETQPGNSPSSRKGTYGNYSANTGPYYNGTNQGRHTDYYNYGESKWSSPSSGWGSNNKFGGFIGKKLFFQVVISLFIFAVAVSVYDSEDPMGKFVAGGFQKLLTTETNVQPLLAKIVNIGLAEEDGLGSLSVMNPEKESAGGGKPENIAGESKPAVAEQVETPLSLPVSGSIITKYGWGTDQDNYPRFHQGIDIKAKQGKKVQAAADGKVIKVGKDKELGNFLRLSHKGELVTLYGHLAEVQVKEGDLVKEGDDIGIVGNTGIAGEAKLHFEVVEKGKTVDPARKLDLLTKDGV
ncbi:MAG: M23 family metallopeptidase [Clostridia bacterium]|nr:M23 family metallopeptidase [Clostridia bacterium]